MSDRAQWVYLVLWVNANDKGMNLYVFQTREAADIAATNLRKMGRDPWIQTESLRTGNDFANAIG